jgi:hypothetical protein
MAQTLLPDTWLDDLRAISDPEVEDVLRQDDVQALLDGTRAHGLLSEKTSLAERAFRVVPQVEVDAHKLLHAQRLFATYGTEIAGALLLAALPQSYAAQWASRVLVATTRLHDDFRRRILGTAQFLAIAMRGAKDEPQVRKFWTKPDDPVDAPMSTPWKACLAVRLYHDAIRKDLERQVSANRGDNRMAGLLGEANRTPLNQEDLLATLLTFTVSVFEVLERYGIAWSDDDQEAYLYAWDVIGQHLGIGTGVVTKALDKNFRRKLTLENWHGLRPPTVTDTRLLLEQLRQRQWSPLQATTPPAGGGGGEWQGARAGRILVRALLDELSAAMPRRMRGVPLAVMRTLAPGVVRDRLSLGGSGVVLSLLDLLPERQVLVDRFTALRAPNLVGGGVVRVMANQVTTNVIVRFIQSRRLLLPGLAGWSEGLADPMHMAARR